MAGQSQGWQNAWCNFEYQECLSYTDKSSAPSGYPSCYLDGTLSQCAQYTKVGWDAIDACAKNSTSEQWMKQSAARTVAASPSGHPLWCVVDGKNVEGNV